MPFNSKAFQNLFYSNEIGGLTVEHKNTELSKNKDAQLQNRNCFYEN